MKLLLSFYFLFSIQPLAYSFQSNPDSLGNILILFSNYYYVVQENVLKRVEAKEGITKTDLYNNQLGRIFKNERQVLQKAKEFLLNGKSKLTLSFSEPNDYSANPSAEYVMRIRGPGLSENIIIEVFNIITGDTINITTSDWSIRFSFLHYAWSSDGQWLAILKDDKRESDQHGNSILIVNLKKKEIQQYQLDEHIEAITWNPQSDMVAILTEEWLRARTVWNYIIPMLWIQPQTVRSFYLYNVKPDLGILKKIEIAHRIEDLGSYGIYWIN